MTEQAEDDMGVIQKEAQAWVVRLASGQVSERDAQVFRHWCARSRKHANAFAEARAVWGAMAPAARAVKRAQAPVNVARRAWLGGAVAASLGLLVLRPPTDLWPAVAGLAADYATGTGEQREVALDGGVLVQMNTQTRLDAAPLQDGAAALVLLAGEAEFQAGLRGAARVRVQAGDGTVSAGSARFNIRLFGQEVCVTCLAGRLRVAQAGNDAELAAGQQLRYRPEHFGIARAVAKSDVSAWRHRLLVFKQSTLAEVVDEVNRYRPGKLILNGEALKLTRVQASFSLDRLDDVIALIQDAYGARVTRLPGGIVLFG
ncbi:MULTISPECIES: FecR domain-containing protein [Janthinobacterium]|uniref:FecR domain-containing protein n=1 Tax=Janthinobacterium rivuli TaxID=2751478 RepID=A0ABY8I4D7_9BURK|nr:MULTISPECIES: FecR domain-containing protein [Janthinobacterium]WFR79735.1 FecR domain-containing protein [Janthinobacterium rivuli]